MIFRLLFDAMRDNNSAGRAYDTIYSEYSLIATHYETTLPLQLHE